MLEMDWKTGKRRSKVTTQVLSVILNRDSKDLSWERKVKRRIRIDRHLRILQKVNFNNEIKRYLSCYDKIEIDVFS